MVLLYVNFIKLILFILFIRPRCEYMIEMHTFPLITEKEALDGIMNFLSISIHFLYRVK